MSKVTYRRGYVYSIKYHIVWCTKYRHKVLAGKIDYKLKEIIKGMVKNLNVVLTIIGI